MDEATVLETEEIYRRAAKISSKGKKYGEQIGMVFAAAEARRRERFESEIMFDYKPIEKFPDPRLPVLTPWSNYVPVHRTPIFGARRPPADPSRVEKIINGAPPPVAVAREALQELHIN